MQIRFQNDSISFFWKLYHRVSIEIKIITTMLYTICCDNGPPEIQPKIQLIADETITIRDYGGGGWNFNCWRWPVAQVQASNVNRPAALQKSPRHKSQKLLPFFGWHEPVAGVADGDGNGSGGVGGASMQLSNDVWDDASLFTYFGFGVNKLTHSSRDMLMV